MPLTAFQLRENIYKILDQVLETGIPVKIERAGRLLKIVPADRADRSKLDNLEEHPGFLLRDAEDLVHIDWTKEWKP